MTGILSQNKRITTVADAYFNDAYDGYKLVDYKGVLGEERLDMWFQPVHDLPTCPHCRNQCKTHATVERCVRCAPRDGFSKVFIHLPIRRVRCPHCKVTAMEWIPWLESGSRLTDKLIACIQEMLRSGATLVATAKRFDLDWSTVKRLDKLQLENVLAQVDFHGVKNLIVDEFSIEKGRKYAFDVMDADTHRMLWISRGRKGDEVRPFFEMLKTKGYANQIESVSMDMNACYPSLVREYLSNAVILYDNFHVLQMFTRDVLVPARKRCQEEVQQRYKDSKNLRKQALRALRSSQWVLVAPSDTLEADEREKLENVRRDNQLLADLYPIADMIRMLWSLKDKQEATRLLHCIHQMGLAIAREFKFFPIRTFVQTLKRRMDGIIQAGRYGYSTCPLEGAHNKIKVLKRIAYGFRDFEYFKLKIMSILSGKKFNPWLSLTPATVVTARGKRMCCFHTNSR